jgi:hypothetical protein
MATALFIPLDDRPCTARFPQSLAAIAGTTLQVPPLEWLGNPTRAARLRDLHTWVESRVSASPLLLLSLDTWIYGGLIPSRQSRAPQSQLAHHWERLCALKASHPELVIHGFATLQRISDSHDATEEQSYWAQYGREIHHLSACEHQQQVEPSPAGAQALLAAQQAVPVDIVADYRALRARNYALLEQMVQGVADGLLASLTLGCDDGTTYGWNVQERQALAAHIQQLGLEERVWMYPGADELAHTLVARVLAPTPLRVQIHWTHPEQADAVTRYEGIPLSATLAAQAQAAGIVLVTDEPEARLWIHNPTEVPQRDQYLEREVPPLTYSPAQVAQALERLLAAGQPVALADVRFANGGDLPLLQALEEQQLLFRLRGYSAWNTAGNTLGTALAWLKLAHSSSDAEAHLRFLIERYADDGWYQGHLRQQLCAHYSEPVTLNACVKAIAFLNDQFRNWQPQWVQWEIETLEIARFAFPWKRFFEVDLRACLKMRDGVPASGPQCLEHLPVPPSAVTGYETGH